MKISGKIFCFQQHYFRSRFLAAVVKPKIDQTNFNNYIFDNCIIDVTACYIIDVFREG